ncbi:SH3 domain-containing protein [Sutcliffiella cohnii]|uniref:SH3 domain-containing protein n=1 Tax=Sutcliffiella cohnii TaxID=33932 RepID=UPI002E1CD942|nr:SH3 domain-containing protein [Sutcliffiella cohnii]
MYRKLKVIIALAIILTSFLYPLSSNKVEASQAVRVATDVLNVREQPSTSSAIVTKVKRGETYPLVTKQKEWYKIKVGNKEGWVASYLVVETNSVSSNANNGVKILADSLRVRSGPGTNFSIVAFVHKSSNVTYIEENENWVKIRVDGKDGWVSKQYASISKTSTTPSTSNSSNSFVGEVTATSLNVRSEPSSQGKVVGSVKKGQQITVLGQQGSWYKIQHSNQQAWVSSEYVKTTSTPSSNSSSQKTNAVVTASSLNVRSEGSLNGKVVGSLTRGANVTIVNEQNSWAEIEYSGGKKGWVAGWYLEKKAASTVKPQANTTGNVVVLHNGTNIRSQANTSSSVVARANEGDTFQIVSVVNDWYKIKLSNGKEAYIAGWIVSTSGTTQSITRPGSEQYLKGKTIVIDPGHGGRDVGAIGVSGRYEKDLTMRTANLLADKLKAAGANVHLTRSNDTFLSLQGRVQTSHYHRADAFLSLHYDSINDPSVTGTTTYYHHASHKKLADAVHSSLIQSTKLRDRNVRQQSFFVLRENRQPSILLELGYISNRAEELTLQSSDYQERATTGIYQGLAQYFKSN